MAEGGERTEQASSKKREDERKKGNVFMSKDVTTIIAVIVSFYVFSAFLQSIMDRIGVNFLDQMERAMTMETLHVEDVSAIAREIAILIGVSLLPAMAIIGLVTFLAGGAQTKFLFAQENIKFKLNRLSPLKGIKRLFSLRSIVELLKSMVKITLLIYLLYGQVRAAIDYVPAMMDWDIMQAAVFTGEEIMSLVVSVAIAFGVVAAVDFLYQRWEYEKGIRMTKQEVKDEYKQMEGNPEVKSARRQKQREMAQSRMMAQVQNADVVVRNPTHFAVALKYDIENDPAPFVLAKGADHIALKIVAEAEKHGVATIENKPLARGLYDSAQIDSYIPAEFFQPVAELLAWLYAAQENAGKSAPRKP